MLVHGLGEIATFGIAAALLAGCSTVTADYPVQTRTGPVGACTPYQMCTFANPEDIADLPGTQWILISEQADAKNGTAVVTLFDVKDRRSYPLKGSDANPCASTMRAGGIGAVRTAKGFRLARILHGSDDAIELFDIVNSSDQPVAVSAKCIDVPENLFLNDIAPDADGGLVTTHMFDRTEDRAALNRKFLAGGVTGKVMSWSPNGGWVAVPNSEGSFPNGISFSQDGREIAYTETYGKAVNIIDRDGRNKKSIPLSMQPDNVTNVGGRMFIVSGGTGVPFYSTASCPKMRDPGCGFPAAILEIDFDGMNYKTLVASGGRTMPGASVAVLKDGALYIGTSFGNRITIVPSRSRTQTIR